MFCRCTSLLLIPALKSSDKINLFIATLIVESKIPKRGNNLPQIDDIIKDLHFEYTVDKSIVGETFEVKLIRITGKHFINDYWYDCLISRPVALALDDIDCKPISDIRLVFTYEYIMEAKFNVESILWIPCQSGCIIL